MGFYEYTFSPFVNGLLNAAFDAIDAAAEADERDRFTQIYSDLLTALHFTPPLIPLQDFNEAIHRINCHMAIHGVNFLPGADTTYAQADDIPLTFEIQQHNSEYAGGDCPICQCEPTVEVFRCIRCQHEVCADCMRQWLNTYVSVHGLADGLEHEIFEYGLHQTCPYCNLDLNGA